MGLMYQNFNDFLLKHIALLLNKSNHLTGDGVVSHQISLQKQANINP
jgi:hypothetical protein